MKKIFALLLSVMVLASCLAMLTFSAHALTDELLVNGDFEEGDLSEFFLYGPAAITEVESDYAHSGDYGLLMDERGGQYSTYAQKITATVYENGPGTYRASMWAKLAPGEDRGAKCLLVVNFRENGATKDSYITSASANLTDEWQEFTFEKDINFDLDKGLEHVYIYAQVQGVDANGAYSDEGPSYWLDDLSLKKVSEVNGRPMEKPEDVEKTKMTHIEPDFSARSLKTTFGAIRWDAWFGHKDTSSGVCAQVERSLSPAKYHFRAPFFATVTEDDKIYIPEYTQEIFDKEMEYAIEAGIDYFAYVWYKDDMRMARDFHLNSKYKNQVKICPCLDGNAIGHEYARIEICKLFSEECCMTVLGGRPLMYYFSGGQAVADDIQYYRAYCEKKGIPAPYAVIMTSDPVGSYNIYGDATSSYAVGGSNGQSYVSLTKAAQTRWESWRATGKQYVPDLTAGWHDVTRWENPVSWTTSSASSWAEYATPEEIAAHVKNTLDYMQKPDIQKQTAANTMLIYAWNEHDEGGWLCPTIEVDENGKQVKNADGTAKINDTRIKAVGKAVTEWYAEHPNLATPAPTEAPTTAPTAAPDATNAPQATEEPKKSGCKSALLPPAAIVLFAGAVLSAKKKENN